MHSFKGFEQTEIHANQSQPFHDKKHKRCNICICVYIYIYIYIYIYAHTHTPFTVLHIEWLVMINMQMV